MHQDKCRHRVHAEVLGCLRPGELRIVVLPGYGLADGGAHWDVPLAIVPFECRMPNTLLWITFEEGGRIVSIEPRAADDRTSMY
jgi:hypothetical protein